MSNPNNFDAASGYFTFSLPGAPLTLDSNPAQLNSARNQLTEQMQGLPFPIPASMPVGLDVFFHYPHGTNNAPGPLDRNTIALELTLGILYEDHGSVCSKSVMGLVAAEGVGGSTKIRVRVLEEGDIPQPPSFS